MELVPIYKKNTKMINLTIGLLSFYQTFQKYMKLSKTNRKITVLESIFNKVASLRSAALLILFWMAFFGGLLTDGGAQKDLPSLRYVTHILQWLNLASYTLPKEDPKNMNHLTHPSSSVDISIFSLEINKFCYIKKYRYRFHFFT